MTLRLRVAAMVAALAGGAALADGDALILTNGEYADLPRLPGANRVLAAAEALEAQGIDVIRQVEAAPADMADGLARFLAAIDADTDRVAVILSGRFAHSAAETYLLPVDAALPLDEGRILTEALALSWILGVMADFPGQAVLLLAEEEMDDPGGARFLRSGAGEIETPQGVSLVRGTPREIERLARRDLAEPERNLVEAVSEAGLTLEGYAPARLVFIDAAAAEDAARRSGTDGARDGERRLWQSVAARDDIAGYETYLSAYPDGPNAAEARDRIAGLRDAPRRQAEAAEDALGLGRSARQAIQRDLTTLDYDTRGVDGIFGPGTRNAIERWQEANDLAATGYLTAAQVDRIAAQAERIAAAEAARAEEERALRERHDRAYWHDLGEDPGAGDLRAYLDRFPDGIFAREARARLERLEDGARDRAAVRDRDAFAAARERDTVGAYQGYIEDWPEGAFVERARNRIAALRRAEGNGCGGGDGRAARARQEEAALGLPQPARALAEERLRAAGADPGNVDGVFDQSTRAALRRYQEARGIPVSGFLDQATAARLLAESIFGR